MVKIIKHPHSHCAYNVLITGDGTVHQARGWDETGQATGTFNGFHLDICLTGNFNVEHPGQQQLKALEMELAVIEKKYGSYILAPHSKYYPTECPGDFLRAWINQRSKN